jgi:hypothetical protein
LEQRAIGTHTLLVVTINTSSQSQLLCGLRTVEANHKRLTAAVMSSIASARLAEERKNWRKDHPAGFIAKPMKNEDESLNLLKWEAGIPGPENTDWAGEIIREIFYSMWNLEQI